jgi:hypothetical protein
MKGMMLMSAKRNLTVILVVFVVALFLANFANFSYANDAANDTDRRSPLSSLEKTSDQTAVSNKDAIDENGLKSQLDEILDKIIADLGKLIDKLKDIAGGNSNGGNDNGGGNNNGNNGGTDNGGADNGGKDTSPLDGTLNPAKYGFEKARYQVVFDLVEKFCNANKAYVFGAGHKWTSNYPTKTDCSGFVGSFHEKLAELTGVKPAYPRSGYFPSSQVYKTQYTQKITSSFPPPKPRDSIHPGDIFVMNPASSGVGHTGMFMGYDKSGNAIIAHSTPRKIDSRTKVFGHTGFSGVRIETIPSYYRDRWSGVYRIAGTDKMLDSLAKGGK